VTRGWRQEEGGRVGDDVKDELGKDKTEKGEEEDGWEETRVEQEVGARRLVSAKKGSEKDRGDGRFRG